MVALYAARSLLRGSWRLELPMDLVVLVMVAVVMVAVARLRAIASATDDDPGTPSEDGASRSDAEGPTS